MAYLLQKVIKGKKYFYLIKNVRVDKKWKKFSVYVGKEKVSKAQIKQYSQLLEQRVEAYLKSIDPLARLLTEKQIAQLEKIKVKYQKARKAMSAAVKRRYYEWFLTTFTYNTNAIEGSTLNLSETASILFERTTPPGKTLIEIREVENHKKAFDYVLAYKGDVNKAFVCKIHKLMSSGILRKDESGTFRKVQVWVRGAETVPPPPKNVDREIKQLMQWYRKNKKKYQLTIVAAYMHTAFEGIHPFVDYNGRTGRLLLNFILMKYGWPSIAIAYRRRTRYYAAIRAAIVGDLRPFVRLIVRYLKETKL